MPKSKRSTVVPLTKTRSKTREEKDELINKIRDALEDYTDVYTLQLYNIRTKNLQQIRDERRGDSRLFLGNNKILMFALGRDEASSQRTNLYKLGKYLTGSCGLFFTNLPAKEVKKYFEEVTAEVYARTGQVATCSLPLRAGPLTQFPHSMFDHLSRLGLPIKLEKGVIVLLRDTTVCEVGETLSAEAAQLLKLYGIQSAEFKVELTAHWANGVTKRLVAKKQAD
uniref:Ribosome assembly factor mrt4 n=1 Tax=Trypanosoma congolense (strain IL3000) TaxID=1068625 RepID=G0UXE2_TRYCI|nr:unnamed protein product [Trypanosoma congolense IL3000]